MITTYSSGTVTINGSVSNTSFATASDPGKYILRIDLNELAANEWIQFHILLRIQGGGDTQRRVWYSPIFAGVQDLPIVVIPEVWNDVAATAMIAWIYSGVTGASRDLKWALMKDDALVPTTAGNKLDVTSGGAAGIDWGNVENPTTTVGLSGTTVKTASDVETDTQDIQARLPAALTSNGNMKSDVLRVRGLTIIVGTVLTGTLTATVFTTDLGTGQQNVFAADDSLNDCLVAFTSGTLVNQVKKVSDYTALTGLVTVSSGFTGAPSNGDTFLVINA